MHSRSWSQLLTTNVGNRFPQSHGYFISKFLFKQVSINIIYGRLFINSKLVGEPLKHVLVRSPKLLLSSLPYSTSKYNNKRARKLIITLKMFKSRRCAKDASNLSQNALIHPLDTRQFALQISSDNSSTYFHTSLALPNWKRMISNFFVLLPRRWKHVYIFI